MTPRAIPHRCEKTGPGRLTLQPERLATKLCDFACRIGLEVGGHVAPVKPLERPVEQLGKARVAEMEIDPGAPRNAEFSLIDRIRERAGSRKVYASAAVPVVSAPQNTAPRQ